MALRRLRAAVALGVAVALPSLGSPLAALAADPTVVTLGSGPVALSLVAPLSLPATDGGLISAETLAVVTAPTGSLTRELDQLLAVPAVTIGLDPIIPASIRILGSDAPDTARAWLARLEAAENEVFLLGYADADLGALASADALDSAAPLSLDFAVDPGRFGPAVTPSPSPTPSDSATPGPTESPAPSASPGTGPDDVPPLPTTADLLAWPTALPGIAWPAEDSVPGAALGPFAAAGYTHLLLDSSNVSGATSALAELGDVEALVSDATLSALVRTATFALTGDDRASALARLGAALADLAARSPGRTVLATLDRHSPTSAFEIAAVGARLAADPAVRLVPLSAVIAGPSSAASLVEPAGDEARSGRVAAMLESDEQLTAFASILEDPLLLLAPRRLELLSLLSLSWLESGDWDAASSSFLDRNRELLASVQVVDGSTLQVISTSTNLRVSVSNALDYPVTVRIVARPLRPLIRVDGPVELTIEPGSSKTATIPAEAITNGQVSIQITLVSPLTGHQIGVPKLLQVNLQAQWEGFGIAVGAIIVLVFAAGIVRNVVVRRRARGRADDPASDG